MGPEHLPPPPLRVPFALFTRACVGIGAAIAGRLRLRGGARQRLLPFLERTARTDRKIRAAIAAVTLLTVVGLWFALPSGSANALELVQRTMWQVLRLVGMEPPRSEVDAYWRDRRDRRELITRAGFRAKYQALGTERQAFLRVAGMGPDDAVIRWGNYDMTLVMSGKVFERDDAGRYYRLRPGVHSAWFRQVDVLGMDVCQFLFPDTPEVHRTAAEAGAQVVAGVSHTTNSWGCRGPEPNMSAPLRGLVLGDSFMQGYLVDDTQTPPERLRRHLQSEAGTEVALLNTGTLGYCPEHYYYTLKAYADSFCPGFVVLGVYSNDFGEDPEVLSGKADWAEGRYWIERITQLCRSRGVMCLVAPVPCQSQLSGPRSEGHYPGQVANMTGVIGPNFCDVTDAFVDEDLRLRRAMTSGQYALAGPSPLYNGRLGDGHLSPLGAELWGRLVAHRLALILRQLDKSAGMPLDTKPTPR